MWVQSDLANRIKKMANENRIFENARVEVGGQTSKPMTIKIALTVKGNIRSGAGEAKLSTEVFDEIEAVSGAGTVHTDAGGTFSIMIRKAYSSTNRVEFVTSGPVPDF